MLDFGVLEPLLQRSQPHTLHQLGHEDLDENTAATRRIVFVHLDALKARPADGVRGEQVAEEPCDVAKAIRFVAMDGLVVCVECLFEAVGPYAI
jgi:hypothetical protein